MPRKKKTELGIRTPKGKRALEHEQKALRTFTSYHPSLGYISPDSGEPAVIDAFFFMNKGSRLYAVAEVKARNMELEQLAGEYEWRWMISQHKLDRGRLLADMLLIPFVGILYLVPSSKILVQELINKNGEDAVDMFTAETITSATINGGRAIGNNAFIDMKNAKEYLVK
tara:strand:+ start:1973 stop:2482 length:510 start_codon:yes stop_codon:yes gene_type:complete